MTLDLDAITARAFKHGNLVHGSDALWAAKASADDVPTLLAALAAVEQDRDNLSGALAHADGEVEQLRAERDDMRARLVALANLANNDADNDDESGELARAVLAIIGTYGWPADEDRGQGGVAARE